MKAAPTWSSPEDPVCVVRSGFHRCLGDSESFTPPGIGGLRSLQARGRQEGLADDIYKRIGSTVKKKVVSPISGHDMMLVDKELFCSEVANFVAQNP